MNSTPNLTHSVAPLHEEAGTNKIPNVADWEASSAPAAPMRTPTHSPLLINTFLKALDPTAERFTLQLFRDPRHRKVENTPRGLRLIHHCTIDEAVALAREWNTPEHGYGLYVTINQTDLAGRTRKNIIRVRAVCVDADGDLEGIIARLKGLLKPSAVVQSSRGRAQIYWWVDDAFPSISSSMCSER